MKSVSNTVPGNIWQACRRYQVTDCAGVHVHMIAWVPRSFHGWVCGRRRKFPLTARSLWWLQACMHGLLMSAGSAGLWLRRKESDTVSPWSSFEKKKEKKKRHLDIRQVGLKQCPSPKCKLLGQRSPLHPHPPSSPLSSLSPLSVLFRV